jgi:hypothetical protein
MEMYIEEYSPDLQYIKGTHNVVADTLSCLEIKETPYEDTQESFLGLMECLGKKADTDELHPLNYQQLKNAQDKDKTIQKILKMPKTLYLCKDFHGEGKTTSLVCFQRKDCHSRTTSKACYSLVSHHSLSSRYKPNRRDNWTTPLVAKNASTHNHLCTNLPPMSEKQEETKEVWITPTKVS